MCVDLGPGKGHAMSVQCRNVAELLLMLLLLFYCCFVIVVLVIVAVAASSIASHVLIYDKFLSLI